VQAALAMPDMIWSDSGRGQECTLRSGTREVWDAQTGEEVNDHVLPSFAAWTVLTSVFGR